MSSLRTEIIEAMLDFEWRYVVRFGQKLNGVKMAHDLLMRSVDTNPTGRELALVVVSEQPGMQVALNCETWYEANAARRLHSASKAYSAPLQVILCQGAYQHTTTAEALKPILERKPILNPGKPRAYWPLTVGIL